MMRLIALAACGCFAFAGSALAALPVGAEAPLFSAPGAKAGEVIAIDLADLLKQGPVVIYFFPSAFTDAAASRDFADRIDRFLAAGASVLGISRDTIDALVPFSLEACAGRFPVASASESLVDAFQVNDGAMFNTRTTFVIAASGKIAFVRDDPEPTGHAAQALAFVEAMQARGGGS